MATDQLAVLVHRALSDRRFLERAREDLERTLAAEGFTLSREELDAVRARRTRCRAPAPSPSGR